MEAGKKIDVKKLRGRTIDEVLTMTNEYNDVTDLGFIFTDGSRVSLRLVLVETGYYGCSTCGYGGKPDVYEIEAWQE